MLFLQGHTTKIDEYLRVRVLETIYSLFSPCDLYYSATENATLIQPQFKLSLITHTLLKLNRTMGLLWRKTKRMLFPWRRLSSHVYILYLLHNMSYHIPQWQMTKQYYCQELPGKKSLLCPIGDKSSPNKRRKAPLIARESTIIYIYVYIIIICRQHLVEGKDTQ